MKLRTIFVSAIAAIGSFLTASASDNALDDVKEIVFYGIDYSMCHTYGWGEDPAKTMNELSRINGLFISEPKKYNLHKFTGFRVKEMDLERSIQATKDASGSAIETFDPAITLDDAKITAAIRDMQLKQTQGVGLIIFGNLLNKAENTGCHMFVFFDIATRKIIEKRYSHGEAGGIGFRNYWAKSVYNSLLKFKKRQNSPHI